MTIIDHIPNPFGGWYLCGYVPTVGRRPRAVLPSTQRRICHRCHAIAARRNLTRVECGHDSDVIGAPLHADTTTAREEARVRNIGRRGAAPRSSNPVISRGPKG